MFDIGWTEMLVVAVIAIIFVGPKELPGMLRTFGRSIKKIRALAGDFQQQFNDAIEDAELDGVRDTIDDVRNLDPTKAIKDKLNPLKGELDEIKSTVDDVDPTTLFDESKAPQPEPPVKVDVDAALERQRKLDSEAAKAAKKKAPAKKTAAKKASASNKTKSAVKPKVPAKSKSTAKKPATKSPAKTTKKTVKKTKA